MKFSDSCQREKISSEFRHIFYSHDSFPKLFHCADLRHRRGSYKMYFLPLLWIWLSTAIGNTNVLKEKFMRLENKVESCFKLLLIKVVSCVFVFRRNWYKYIGLGGLTERSIILRKWTVPNINVNKEHQEITSSLKTQNSSRLRSKNL